MLEFNILKGQYLNRLDKNIVSADTTDKAVYGPYDHDVFVSISDTGRTTTNEYKLTVQRSAFSTNATPGTGGNPTAYEELVEQFDELKADNQTFKDSMTEQQETFESTVTENVDNIRYVVETETAPPIIEEASGAEITLDDSAYRQVRGLNLYGYSRQMQTTGAQLIKYPYLKSDGFTNSGITYTVSDDGIITANGTATDQSLFCMASELSDWRPSGEVFLSGCPSGGSPTTYRMQMCNYNAEERIAIDNGEGTVVNFTNADASWNLCIRIASGYTANNLTFKPMLNSGTSALPWEPYSGGVASPSPDWPQPIHSVADDTNLLDEDLFTQTNTAFRFIHIQTDAESVTVSSNTPRTTGGSAYIQAIPGNVSSMEGITTGTNGVYAGQSRTISPSDGYITIGYFLNGIGNGNINFSDYWVMVNAGDTALPYRPYGHNVTVESAGANLIDVSKTTNAAYNGITVKALGDGTFSYSGTASAGDINVWLAGNWASTKKLIYLRGGEYTAPARDAIYYNDAKWLNGGNKIEVPSNGMPITGVRAPSATVGASYNKIIYPMLNRGSTPLPWQPYVAPSSALITLTDSLRGIPVTSGGTYTDESGQQWVADYIYRRQTDGKWMIWRNVKKGELLSSFSWQPSNNGDRLYYIDHDLISSRGAKIVSNYFKSGIWSNDASMTISLGNDTHPVVGVSTLDFPDVSTLKMWLDAKKSEGNPCYFIAPLATPTIEELPENVQTELNGLYTYNLHTDMWNNDGAYMNLKYVADTKTWINNKIAGLSTAMLNQN
nr:MAG TPA: hypothetical protein [Caudoviricetes sp.]